MIRMDCPGCKTKNVIPLLDNSVSYPLFRCPICSNELSMAIKVEPVASNLPKSLADAAVKHSKILDESAISVFGLVSRSYISANYLTGKKDRDRLFKLDYEMDRDVVEEYQAHLTELVYSRVRQVLELFPSDVAEAEELNWKEAVEKFKEEIKNGS